MMSLLIIFFLISLVTSFLCSMWEATLLSITPSYAQVKLRENTRIGHRLQDFKKNVDRPLAAILTLNTIAHTVGAIGVGAQAALIWSDANPLITSVLVPAVMTLAILVLSEIIPKTLGATHWQALAPFTVNSVSAIIFALYPLVWMSQIITRTLKGEKDKSIFSPIEFLAMAEIGLEEGQIDPRQSEIIQNLFDLHAVPVRYIMTPRTVVVSAPQEMSIREYFESNNKIPYSRIPVYENDSHEAVTGYILKSTLLSSLLKGRGDQPLVELRRDILAVPESAGIRDVFYDFLKRQDQIALVVDEFGGMAGIVTMEDLIETLLGTEIIDEDDVVPDLQIVARQQWEQHADEHGLILDEEDEEDVSKTSDGDKGK